MKIIDLYSGVGGGSCGFRKAGYEPAFACDSDPDARLVYANNFLADIKSDVSFVNPREVVHPEVIFAAPPTKDISAITRVVGELQPRVMVLEFPYRIIDKEKIEKKRQFDIASYKCWHGVLSASDFGLPQKRKLFYIIGFRKDVKTPYISFPFPEPTCQDKTLESVLEATPDQKLFLDEDQIKIVKGRNAKNKSLGMGFKTQIYLPEHQISSLPIAYYKDYRGILVDSGQGPRRLSVLECKRIMGFPDTFKMPISDTNSYRLLAQASPPPVVAAIADELRVWT